MPRIPLVLALVVIGCEAPAGISSTGDLSANGSPAVTATGQIGETEAPAVDHVNCVADSGEADDPTGVAYVLLDDPSTHPIPRVEAWERDPSTGTSTPLVLLLIEADGTASYGYCSPGSDIAVWTYPL